MQLSFISPCVNKIIKRLDTRTIWPTSAGVSGSMEHVEFCSVEDDQWEASAAYCDEPKIGIREMKTSANRDGKE